MSIDELPIEVLFVLVCLGWAAYLIVIAEEWKRNRRHDRDARRAAHRVRSERAEHGRSDHEEERHEEDGSTEEPAEEAEERCVIHARSVHRAPLAMPPGIPSIVERLDRWKD